MQYIPAVRSEEDAFAAIIDLVESELSEINDEEYKKSLELIVKVQQAKLADLASRVKQPLKNFLPQIKDINLNLSTNFLGYTSSFIGRRSICFDVDDGTLTSLRNKGDGVKSLTAIALLSQVSTTKNRLVSTILGKLSELETLYISTFQTNSVNKLPSIEFIKNLTKLKNFMTDYKIEDGNLKPLLNIENVDILKFYKHYNLQKDSFAYI